MTEIQRQLLSVLVLDLGYAGDDRPLYGGAPIRHQIAWQLATEGVDKDILHAEVLRLKETQPACAAKALVNRELRELLKQEAFL